MNKQSLINFYNISTPEEIHKTNKQKKRKKKNNPWIMPDRAIDNFSDDLLDRKNFIINLANLILQWDGSESLVISLNGEWGSGKSSIINLLISEFNIRNTQTPEVISFSPWEWASQEKISSRFFDELSRALELESKDPTSIKIAKKLDLYGKRLNNASHISSILSTFIKIGTSILAGSALIGSYTKTLKIDTTDLTAIATGLVLISSNSESIAKQISKVSKSLKGESNRTLERIKNDLRKELSSKENPILIILDDIDRLSPDQTSMIMQLIKANLGLPNIIFLLSMDRKIVAKQLTTTNLDGEKYLQKIVQVPFEIPKTASTKIAEILTNNIRKIVENNKNIHEIETFTLEKISTDYLTLYIRDLRSVYRFISSLNFYMKNLIGASKIEVHIMDLTLTECLRIFDPNIYDLIYSSKKHLTDPSPNSEETEILLKRIKSEASSSHAAIKLVSELFPNTKLDIKNGHSNPLIFRGNPLIDADISHPHNFDRYFQYSTSNRKLSSSDMYELTTLEEYHKISKKIIELNTRGLLKETLLSINDSTNSIKTQNIKPFLFGLIDSSDQLEIEKTPYKTINTDSMQRIFFRLLRRESSQASRNSLLIELCRSKKGLLQMIGILAQIKETAHFIKSDEENETALVRKESIEKAIEEFSKSILSWVNDTPSNAIGSSKFKYILSNRSVFDENDKVIKEINKLISDNSLTDLYLRSTVFNKDNKLDFECIASEKLLKTDITFLQLLESNPEISKYPELKSHLVEKRSAKYSE